MGGVVTNRPRWCTVEDHGRLFRCRNCGQTAIVALPAPIREWAEAADAFSEAHAGCKEPKSAHEYLAEREPCFRGVRVRGETDQEETN